MPNNPAHVPTATYRLQLHAGFTFEQAAGVADYLARLGVSHAYASPYLQAAPHSTHGYDVVNHSRLNDELGAEAGHETFCRTLQRNNLGQVLDIVPNHMAISAQNTWWQDVLRNGPASPFADYFDIDWDPPEPRLRGKVLMPILGDHYGRALEAGLVRLCRNGAAFHVRYYDHVVPVSFCTLGEIIETAAGQCDNATLAYIADTMNMFRTGGTGVDAVRCARDQGVLAGQLSRLLEEDPAVARAVDVAVERINADADAMDALLARQHYRLAWWRTASQELNYRRFFDINELVGLRTDREPVFAATHSLILKWVDEGLIDGLRVDHPDGLRDPEGYFQRLATAAPDAWLLAEKILEPREHLRESWPVDGTTGYDFANQVGGLFVDPAGEGPLTQFYRHFTGQTEDFETLVYRKKQQVLRMSFATDLARLAALLVGVCDEHRQYCDYTRHQLTEALRETIACFPVYRTYVRPTKVRQPHPDDVRCIREAIRVAHRRRPDLDERLLRFLADVLLQQIGGPREAEMVFRFQQLTGPVTAKAVEDSAFYCYNRLVSLNEVGGNPARFGVTVEAFHKYCQRMQEHWPYTMTSTSTHDTKRSEDVRARIALLSEIPDRWSEAVRHFASLNERYRTDGMPDRNAEYLFYQSLVGAWPIDADRMAAYMLKAAKEAKEHTSWTEPDGSYEEALTIFVERTLENQPFLDSLRTFVMPLVPLGRVNSLAQALARFTAPGVPDLYQGNELWDLSLVDPDNRRPVDYDLRRRLLAELDSLSLSEIIRRSDEGLPKLWLTHRALQLRARKRRVFLEGDYQPLNVRGEKAAHVVAFARSDQVVTVIPRLLIGLGGDWEETALELPPGDWHDLLTDRPIKQNPVPVKNLLDRFAVALLERV